MTIFNSMKTIQLTLISCTLWALSACNHAPINEANALANQPAALDSIYTMDGVFDIPELKVIASPDTRSKLVCLENEKVIDYDVSPAGSIVAILTEQKGSGKLLLWELGRDKAKESHLFPQNFTCKSITWHPKANALFVTGLEGSTYKILRIEKQLETWEESCIYSTTKRIRRLVACPRPFITSNDTDSWQSHYLYRIFFGLDNGDSSYRIVSITEFGTRFYQVIGPKNTFTGYEELNADIPPSLIEAPWALPIGFHPAGHKLIWENKQNQFQVASYNSKAWGDSEPMKGLIKKGGTITPTPNGLGLIHWQKDIPGIELYRIPDQIQETQLTDFLFLSTPSSVPDGKGIVGLTNENNRFSLVYLPIQFPLADVFNAWMYIESAEDLSLFQQNYGLFRPNHSDQLYKLYETENYYCNSYDKSAPTRPYLVTTDIFWELFGAAYQGLFIVKERDEAVPHFWQFVEKAGPYFDSGKSIWKSVFRVVQEFKLNSQSDNPEVQRIINEIDDESDITQKVYAYSNLKPRGHYTSTPEMERYFKAFKYLTTILISQPESIQELENLPDDIKKHAIAWIGSYTGFLAPSRNPSIWKEIRQTKPAYCKYPGQNKSLFPLSWGFDNEVLNATVYHLDFPKDEQIVGPTGTRLSPTGLDIAAAFSNHFADSLLQPDYTQYPPLKRVIQNLRENFKNTRNHTDFTGNLYNQWLNAIAIQWSDTLQSMNGKKDNNLWQVKRLQTGLATWATLRHATVLVNERTGAECGEGGFEEILMRAPRGYVEPDPYTFSAIAALFDRAAGYVSTSMKNNADISESYNAAQNSLYEGILSKLQEAAEEARGFQQIAEKERKGLELSNEENEKILYVARIAEHLFLIFNSLSNKDFALSNPDPMPKIADVAGDAIYSPYLLAAVGNSIEWNHIVPFYGRHQIVKGAVYSYYEFKSSELLNDEEWRMKVENQEFLYWIKPYISKQTAFDMAKTGY